MEDEQPQEEDPSTTGRLCFMDAGRMCSAECMAFETYPKHPSNHMEVQATHCSILAYGERAARSLNIISSVLSQHSKKSATAAADALREGQLPTNVPNVSGVAPGTERKVRA